MEFLPEGMGGEVTAYHGCRYGEDQAGLASGEKGQRRERVQTKPGHIVATKRVSSNLAFPLMDFGHTGLFAQGQEHDFLLELQMPSGVWTNGPRQFSLSLLHLPHIP